MLASPNAASGAPLVFNEVEESAAPLCSPTAACSSGSSSSSGHSYHIQAETETAEARSGGAAAPAPAPARTVNKPENLKGNPRSRAHEQRRDRWRPTTAGEIPDLPRISSADLLERISRRISSADAEKMVQRLHNPKPKRETHGDSDGKAEDGKGDGKAEDGKAEDGKAAKQYDVVKMSELLSVSKSM